MKNSFSFGFFVALIVCSSVKAENEDGDDSPNVALASLKDVYLQNWDSEINDSRSVLVYPVGVLQEFLLEHALRMPDGSPQKAKLAKVMPFDTGLPFALDLTNITLTPPQALTVQTLYTNRTPAMNNSLSDPLFFSYKAFVEWTKIHLDPAADPPARPFNPLLTVAAIRINAIESSGFTFIDKIDFHVSEEQRIEVDALRNVGLYDYAEFSFPRLNDCVAGALRLRVDSETDIIFAIARNVSDPRCTSPENLFKILEDNVLETLSFSSKRMFVSIPILRVSSITWPARRLIQLGLLDPKPNRMQPSLGDHYESATLIFDPEVPADAPIPMISPDTPSFQAVRPFLVTVLQKENPVPVLAGLIQNPTSGFECCSAIEPPRISLTILNKGRRPKGPWLQRTRQSMTTMPSI